MAVLRRGEEGNGRLKIQKWRSGGRGEEERPEMAPTVCRDAEAGGRLGGGKRV